MTFEPLTAKQKTLLQAVRKGSGRDGIYALSLALDRPYRRVYDNVKLMEARGYVRLSPIERAGRAAFAITPAVTGAVMTTVNVSLPQRVSPQELLAGLTAAHPLAPAELTALTSFFAEVPATLAMRFLNEHGIALTQAAAAYQRHLLPRQRLPSAETWLYVR